MVPKIFGISDTHAWHTKIILYENRPFENAEEMNTVIIEKWNSTINDNDIVFHLGDVVLGGSKKRKAFIDSLKGRKILVMGNHDMSKPEAYWIRLGFVYASKKPLYFPHCILSHRPLQDPPLINYHGHVHSKRHHKEDEGIITQSHVNLSVEVIDYKPILFPIQHLTWDDVKTRIPALEEYN